MVISLDFELLWGMIDHADIDSYGENILGARKAVVRILELFEKYGIHATWGVVGFLFLPDVRSLHENLPKKIPGYTDQTYCTYSYISKIKDDDGEYFFAPDLIQKIKGTPNQEIATHTYSHFYCLEYGQDRDEFEEDLLQARKVAKKNGIDYKSIIFPRNQMNPEYAEILRKNDIKYYRGNEKSWCNRASNKKNTTLLMRLFRFLDSYINLTGNQCYDFEEISDGDLKNIRSSRFFRPYNPKFALFEKLKLHRIKKQMYYAAKHGKVFHIWWHPHNFGRHLEENLNNLEVLLHFYSILNRKFQFESMNMDEVGRT